MSKRRVAYLHDASPADLRGRTAQLEAQLGEAGALEAWEIRPTSSRNSLLLSIDADARESAAASVTLLDLRAETGDLDQVGFRICETIARHPALGRATRPTIWTDVHSAANLHYGRSAGARAIVDDAWVDSGHGAPLAEVLAWARGLPASLPGAVGEDARVFPPDAPCPVEESAERADLFARWFGFRPSQLHFALLWGMADAVELSFLDTYLAETGVAASERAARRQRERLQASMRPMLEAMEAPAPARAEVARRFLAEVAPAEPSRIAELDWPTIDRVRELFNDRPDTVRWAFATNEALTLLRRLLDSLDPLPAGTRAGAAQRHARIEEAVAELLGPLGRPLGSGTELLRSTAQAVADAEADRLRYGKPARL